MADPLQDTRIADLLALVLEVADGNYSARIEPSDRGDDIDAVTVGLNLVAESLELERERRRRAEALLRDEVHAYEQAPAMFCSIDWDNFEIVKCNETLAAALGVRKEDLLQRRLLGFLPPGERAAADAALCSIREGRLPELTTFHLVGPGKVQIPILLSGSASDPSGARIRLVLRDVSLERTLEEQLRRAQKLEAVGRLASGVAHDFNNILAVVLGSAALLKRLLPEHQRGRRELSAIINAAENGAGLTRQLLALSKPVPEFKAPDGELGSMIREALPLLRRALGSASDLVLELTPEELNVRIDPSELIQVLLNLTVNARDAMIDGGRLTIATALESREGEPSRVVLEVEDTGHGMDAGLLEQVLEPFFTTKEESGGSGLGLTVCRRIVRQWRGELEIRSEPKAGTRIRITIPAVATSEVAADESKSGSRPAKQILVVDDDQLVREVITFTLEEAGYDVLSADGLEMALERVRGIHDLFLVVTDVVMPGKDGVDVAKALWETRPELGVIFVSGYTGSRIDATLLARPNVRFVGKPFDADQLIALVAEVGGGNQ